MGKLRVGERERRREKGQRKSQTGHRNNIRESYFVTRKVDTDRATKNKQKGEPLFQYHGKGPECSPPSGKHWPHIQRD